MPRVLVANSMDGSVTFFDATTRKKLKTVKVGASPQGIAPARNGKFGYVSNAADNSISTVDVIRMSETAQITPDGVVDPRGIAVLPDGRSLFVTSGTKAEAYVVDATTGALRRTIELGGPVSDSFAISGSGDRVWLADPVGNRVLAVDPRSGERVAEHAVDGNPGSVALRRDQRNLLVALRGPAQLATLDAQTGKVQATAEVGLNPVVVAQHPYAEEAFVLSRGGGSMFVVALGDMSVQAPLPVGLAPSAFAVARAGKVLYVANSESDTLSVIDVTKRQIRDTWDTGHNPGAVVFLS